MYVLVDLMSRGRQRTAKHSWSWTNQTSEIADQNNKYNWLRQFTFLNTHKNTKLKNTEATFALTRTRGKSDKKCSSCSFANSDKHTVLKGNVERDWRRQRIEQDLGRINLLFHSRFFLKWTTTALTFLLPPATKPCPMQNGWRWLSSVLSLGL